MENSATYFEAEIYVLTTEEGGRQTPFYLGYRPHLCSAHYVTGSCSIDRDLSNPKSGTFEPGGTYLVEMWPFQSPHPRFAAGERFGLYEGANLVAVGEVKRVYERK